MQKSVLFIFAIFLLPLSTKGVERDSISIIKDSYYNNPAMNFYRHTSAVSSIDLSTAIDNRKAYLMQDGEGYTGVQFKVSSWMPLNDRNKIWGSASYNNFTRKDVKWNETSDVELLYPYIMADSVGGDMKGQRYMFNGGYAGKFGKLILGGEIGYRAQIEYRDIDPRPRNIISDLMVKAGAGYQINRYLIGAALEYSSYNQKNDVDFYSQLGNAYMHTMTGLGNTYSRFDGTRTSAEYTGGNVKASLQLRPMSGYGLWMNASYNIDDKTRRLTSENNIPLTKMNAHTWNASAAYITKLNEKSEAGIEVNAEMIKRDGTENLFNSGNGASMEVIGNRKPYKENNDKYSIELFYKNNISSRYSLAIKPSAASESMDMSHSDNNRKMKFTRMSFGSAIENKFNLKGWSLNVTAQGYYQPVSSNSISISSVANKGMEQMLLWNYNVLTADRTMFGIKATAYVPMQNTTLFLKAGWSEALYSASNNENSGYTLLQKSMDKRNNNKLELNLGILF